MRYYHYISDTKVDQLADRIPQSLWDGLAKEFKLSVKVIQVTLKEKTSDNTRYSKVALVERYLREQGELGAIWDVGESSQFFAGKLAMQWGPYVHHTGGDYIPGWPMVWFAGETAETTIGLAGSRRHVIGETGWTVPNNVQRDTPAFTSYSTRTAVLDALRAADDQDDVSIDQPDPDMINIVSKTTRSALHDGQMAGVPPVVVEFVAHRLLEGDLNGKHVVLGSPIFVAEP